MWHSLDIYEFLLGLHLYSCLIENQKATKLKTYYFPLMLLVDNP